MGALQRRVNLFDIARSARVSVGAVAEIAGGGRSRLGAEARARVVRSMEYFSYHADRHALALARGRKGVIAFASPIGTRPHLSFIESEILRGVSSEAARRGLDLQYVLVPPRGRFPTRDHAAGADGTVVFDHAIESPAIRPLLNTDHLVVLANRLDETLPSVGIDNRAGARAAVEHLLGLGHGRIALVLGEGFVSDERLAAAREALSSAGVRAPLEIPARWSRHEAAERIRRPLASPHRPTAVFAFSDWMAMGVIAVAREAGLHVPRDLSVVGFDDVMISEVETPPLTTVRQPLGIIGARAVRLLTDLLGDHPGDRAQVLVEPALVTRRTTAPPRSR